MYEEYSYQSPESRVQSPQSTVHSPHYSYNNSINSVPDLFLSTDKESQEVTLATPIPTQPILDLETSFTILRPLA